MCVCIYIYVYLSLSLYIYIYIHMILRTASHFSQIAVAELAARVVTTPCRYTRSP